METSKCAEDMKVAPWNIGEAVTARCSISLCSIAPRNMGEAVTARCSISLCSISKLPNLNIPFMSGHETPNIVQSQSEARTEGATGSKTCDRRSWPQAVCFLLLLLLNRAASRSTPLPSSTRSSSTRRRAHMLWWLVCDGREAASTACQQGHRVLRCQLLHLRSITVAAAEPKSPKRAFAARSFTRAVVSQASARAP